MRALGWDVRRCELVGKRGWPDTTAHRDGRVLYVEWKAPGEKLKPQQVKVIAELRAAGMTVIVADKWEDVEPYAK